MINVNTFPYNDFQINTYVLTADNKDCIIIDPGCYYAEEKQHFLNFIEKNKLSPKLLVNTHGHVDHVAGNSFVNENFDIQVAAHKDDEFLMQNAELQGMMFGFNIIRPPAIEIYLDEGDTIDFDNDKLNIIHLPGHSPGSIAILSKKNNFIIVGDVLFKNSIGRTDFQGGNHETLIKSIKEKILPLNDQMTVYSGHGPSTTVGFEKNTNPFLI